jgi:hypothetical protein
MGLHVNKLNSGYVTLQFFTRTGTAFDPVVLHYSGNVPMIFQADGGAVFAGVTITNDDPSGCSYDDLRLVADVASATFRNGGTNPASYTVSALPVLGDTFTGSVDLGGTTGHAAAMLLGYFTPMDLLLPGGQTLLVNVSDPNGEQLHKRAKLGPTALFHIPVPADPWLAGTAVYTQAVHIDLVNPWVLSNAQDLVLGY